MRLRILGKTKVSLSPARGAAKAAYKSGVVSFIEVVDVDVDGRVLQTRDECAQAETYASRAAVASF